MKKLAILLLVILCLTCLFTACDNPTETYTITSPQNSYNVTIGQQLDYRGYFTIVSSSGKNVTVTDEMIDATEADLTKAGAFIVTCSYEGASKTIIFVVADDGGNQGGEDGGNQGGDGANKEPITTTFNSAQMGFVESNGLTFSASPSPASFADGRGLQFTQINGDATLTSASSLTGVTYVTVVVQTNQTLGMNVSVKVGNTSLTCEGNTTVLVAKTDYTVHNTITFVASSAVDGQVHIALETTANDKSMYILQVVVGFGEAPMGGETTNLDEIFTKYDDYDKWNFQVDFDLTSTNEEYDSSGLYGYQGADCWYKYDYDGYTYTDYIVYDDNMNAYWYSDNGDGTYLLITENDADFEYFYYDYFELTTIGSFEFIAEGDHYTATNANATGTEVLGTYENIVYTYTDFDVYVSNGYITKITAVANDGEDTDTYTLNFSAFGTITVDVSNLEVENGSSNPDQGDGGNTPDGETVDLSQLFTKYDDYDKWNFEVDFTTGGGEYVTITYYYGYDGCDAWLMYDYDGAIYVDYLVYVGTDMFLYSDNGDGTHTKLGYEDEDFYYYYLFDFLDLTQLGVSQYVENGDHYSAVSPSTVGDAVLGEDLYASATYVSFDVYVTDGNISKIVAVQSDDYTYTLELYNYGKVEVDVSTLDIVDDSTGGSEDGGNQGGDSSQKEVMPEQSYDEATHDDGRLNDKIKEYYQGTEYDFSAGLPTTGNVNVLVVPVQFKNGDTFSTTELANLEIAFNGTEQQTGWESVKTYYQKASYGKLNLTFDIQSVFTASQNYTYYKEHTSFDENYDEYLDGTDVLLDEVLAWLDATINLNVYDQLDDGCIDAVYLIYCEDVDYRESWEIPSDEINPDFFWAYVTWSYSEQKYDNLYPYTHMFAGVDFMTEDVTKEGKLLVNAVTYIHETGHVLGLDDYYDYYEAQGSNEGVGGADMMDYTVGDHNAYSKIMLDWVTPTIVTSTQQITLTANTFATNGGVVMLLLDYDGTYFSEYLLIEFYSAMGLNEFHANASESYLYDGAQYGVRIYHVDSTASNPYNDDYGSFTDNNNSMTKDPLIKLVEADGDKNFESSGGYASAGDLWQTGDVFSEIQANYTRNDGRLVNFDIEFVSVTAEGATISITFDLAE